MLIDKVRPYGSVEQLQALADSRQRQEEALREISVLLRESKLAQMEGNAELAENIQKHITEYEKTLRAAVDEDIRIQTAREQAYIDHFNGDFDAILADVAEIVNATEKNEYLSWQKQRTADTQNLIEQLEKAGNKKAIKEIKPMAVKGYRNCYFFILARVRVQLNAAQYFEISDGESRIIEIVENKTRTFYSKPKGARIDKKPSTHLLQSFESDPAEYDKLIKIGAGPTLELTSQILGGDVDTLPDRRRRFNRSTTITVEREGNERTVTSKSKQTKTTVFVKDVSLIAKGNSMTKKILTKVFMHANESTYVAAFPLRDLVGEGMYSNLDTARRGFYNAADILTSLKISREETKGSRLQGAKLRVLFTGSDVDRGTCVMYLNDMLSWDEIVPYYAYIPDFYFNLEGRAADLLRLIFTTARQSSKEIKEQGFFMITYRNIQYHLNLPDERYNKNPGRDIKDEIDKAIEQIEEKYSESAHPGSLPELSLFPVVDPNAPIGQYLDEGKLKVTLRGEYARPILNLNDKITKSIEKNAKKSTKKKNAKKKKNTTSDVGAQ